MTYFVVAGKLDCPNSTHAFHVADFLSKHLPHFKYTRVLKSGDEWPTYLDQLNSLNNWHQTKCPVIWKEISRMGGKPYLIGDLGEFWEYCYDYYGFQSTLSKDDISKIMADNFLIDSLIKHSMHISNISIIGASNRLMLQLIIYELQNSFPIKQGDTIRVKVYEPDINKLENEDEDEDEFLVEQIEESQNILKHYCGSISIVPDVKTLVENCDMLIIIEDFSQQEDEEMDTWIERCRRYMVYLADDINLYAKHNLRIILSHHGPVCFTASVLMEYCTRIKLTNIVAVTADEGITTITQMAKKIGENVENFWCPPVWGFVGVLSYVNIGATPISTSVVRPYRRSLRTHDRSKLPKGVIQTEIRPLENVLAIEDSFFQELEMRKIDETRILKRKPVLAKVRALVSLLKLWCSEEIGDEIISLGVCSNGYFGFPVGVCFSQAVCLNEKRVWEPVDNFHLHKTTIVKNSEIIEKIKPILIKLGLDRNEEECEEEDGNADLSVYV